MNKLLKLILGVVLMISLNVNAEVPKLKLNEKLEIPQLGLGVWELSPEDAYKSVSEALKLGYRLVDTAQYYHNEAQTYQAIIDSGIKRDEIFLMSKLNPSYANEDDIREALDSSLDKLGGYIDLMLIHWPTSADKTQWRILEEYYKDGKFGSIGVSNYRKERLDELLKIATVKPVLDQIEIHPYYTRYEDVQKLQEQGLVVQAWSPLGAGRKGLFKNRTIVKIAKQHNKSPAQVILRWVIQRGIVTIPRSRNPKHLKENIEIFDFELTSDEMKAIDALNKDQALWDI